MMMRSPNFFVDPQGQASPELLSPQRGLSVNDVSMRAPPTGTGVVPQTSGPYYRPNFTVPGAGPGVPPVPPVAPSTNIPSPPQTLRTGADPLPGYRAGAAAAEDASMVARGGAVGRFLSTPSPFMTAGGAIAGAAQGLGTPTEDYYRRLAMDPKDAGVNSFKDLAVRGVGVLSDVGASLLDAPLSVVNGMRSFAGAAPLESFGNILRQNDGAPAAPQSAPKLQQDVPDVKNIMPPQAPPAVAPLTPTDPATKPGVEVAPGIRRIDALGRNPLYTDDSPSGSRNGFGVSVIGGAGDAAAIESRASAIDAQNHTLRQQLDGYGPGVHNADGSGGMASLGGGGPKSVEDLIKEGYKGAGLSAVLDERQQGLTNAASMRNLEVQRLANDRNAAVTMRGQDITERDNARTNSTSMQGHLLNAQIATLNAKRTQDNADRAYKFDVAKFGSEQAERNRTANESALKSQQDHLEGVYRTTDDKGNSVPDHAKIGDFHQAIDATLPAFIKELNASSKPGAKEMAQKLADRGRAALDATALDEMTRLYDTRELARQSRGLTPGSGDFVDSTNLLDYRQAPGPAGLTKGLIADRMNTVNGTSMNTRTMRKGMPINDFNPFGGVTTPDTTRYTRGIRGE